MHISRDSGVSPWRRGVDGDDLPAGIALEPADGAKGPAWVTLIRREGEVNLNDIILPSDNDNPVSAAVSGLAAIGIICRV